VPGINEKAARDNEGGFVDIRGVAVKLFIDLI